MRDTSPSLPRVQVVTLSYNTVHSKLQLQQRKAEANFTPVIISYWCLAVAWFRLSSIIEGLAGIFHHWCSFKLDHNTGNFFLDGVVKREQKRTGQLCALAANIVCASAGVSAQVRQDHCLLCCTDNWAGLWMELWGRVGVVGRRVRSRGT